MKKYDCSKTADLIHEYRRLCDDNITCMSCPIFKQDEWLTRCHLEDLGDAELKMIQKWSDEHPEKPKLKREEYIFIKMFGNDKQYHIFRTGDGTLVVNTSTVGLEMSKWNFQFIKTGESWSFEELLKLEVEDD